VYRLLVDFADIGTCDGRHKGDRAHGLPLSTGLRLHVHVTSPDLALAASSTQAIPHGNAVIDPHSAAVGRNKQWPIRHVMVEPGIRSDCDVR
jgi:hypothetical protein